MLVKNASAKPIGFGSTILMPEDVCSLPPLNAKGEPEGYGPNHPTIKFYLERKWLVPTESKPEPEQSEPNAEEKTAAAETKPKGRSRMSREELREEAAALGIEWAESDTRETLIQKITERLQADTVETG